MFSHLNSSSRKNEFGIFCRTFLLFLGAALFISFTASLSQAETSEKVMADPVAVTPLSGLVPDNLIMMGDGQAFSEYAIVADKSKRTLTLWKNVNGKTELVAAHPMDIGKNDGDKSSSGDARTPEGIYFPQEMRDGARLNYDLYGKRIFTLDYPNFFDRFANKTGYGIWLHAVPDSKSLMRGSRGCVVVRNDIITKLTPFISLKKTPVIIAGDVDYVNPEGMADHQVEILKWIEKWRNAWQSKDIESYIGMYHPDFKSQHMNRDQWKRYKSNLNTAYKTISVSVSKPVFFTRKDEAILNFMQAYESSGKKDFGRKTLYLKKDAKLGYTILGEEWAPEEGLLENPIAGTLPPKIEENLAQKTALKKEQSAKPEQKSVEN